MLVHGPRARALGRWLVDTRRCSGPTATPIPMPSEGEGAGPCGA